EQTVSEHDVIAAPHCGAAARAKEHVVGLAGAARQSERLWCHRTRFDVLSFDPDVDHERAAGQTLAVATMAGVHNQWAVGQPVADRLARASAFEIHGSSSAGPSGITFRAAAR